MTVRFLFIFGWLRVAETLYNPFGEDDEDFELNELLNREIYRKIWVKTCEKLEFKFLKWLHSMFSYWASFRHFHVAMSVVDQYEVRERTDVDDLTIPLLQDPPELKKDIYWNQTEPQLIEQSEWSNVNIINNSDSFDDFSYLDIMAKRQKR